MQLPRNYLLLAAGAAALAGVFLARRARYDLRGRVVVITGGSRGLGLVLARRFVAEGARVALLARDGEELARAIQDLEARDGEAIALRCDVRVRQQVDDAIQEVMDTWGRVDVLVNDAGTIQVGPLEHMDVHDFTDAMAVNVFGPLHTSLAVVPHMRARGEGRIVNIASFGGKVAVPHLLPYCTSKFGLVGLSDGLRVELRRHGILVTTVCPGLMRTGSARKAQFKGQHAAEHAWFAIGAATPLLSISAETAARRIVRACQLGTPRIFVSAPAAVMTLLAELFPGLMTRALSMANGLLPAPSPRAANEAWTGDESESRWAPSWLTTLADEAAQRNLEVLPPAQRVETNASGAGRDAAGPSMARVRRAAPDAAAGSRAGDDPETAASRRLAGPSMARVRRAAPDAAAGSRASDDPETAASRRLAGPSMPW